MPAPELLVERLVDGRARRYGRFAAPPPDVNPLDEFSSWRRVLRRWRLKEWVGFTVTHPDWHCSMIMQDAKYLSSSEVYVYDRRRNVLGHHEAVRPGGGLGLPADLLESACAFRAKGYDLSYELSRERGTHRLQLDIAASRSAPAVEGEIELDAGRASPPLAVSARIPGGALYTHKAILPAQGILRVGDEEITFDGARDVAILDEHKSFLPYRTQWLWGTLAVVTPDGYAGANFADRPSVPGEEEESCLWTPSACEPLADVDFAPRSDDPLAAWQIASRDGRLDVTFEPDGRFPVRHQFGVVAIDYFQTYGHYRGVVRGAERAYDVDGVPGVCESMRARL
jgi:Protein of unknown function (DUF2804)